MAQLHREDGKFFVVLLLMPFYSKLWVSLGLILLVPWELWSATWCLVYFCSHSLTGQKSTANILICWFSKPLQCVVQLWHRFVTWLGKCVEVCEIFSCESFSHESTRDWGQLGAQTWCYSSADWVRRLLWPFKRCGLTTAFSLTSAVLLDKAGERGSDLCQMTMVSTIYQRTQYHSRAVKANVTFTDPCSAAVRITEDEAGNPWRCWAGDGTVSDGDWAELLRGISESTAWTPLSAVWSYSPFTTWTVGKGDIESVLLPSSSHLWGLDVYLPLPGTSWPCLTSFCSNGLKNLSFSYSKPQISSLSYLPAGLGGL